MDEKVITLINTLVPTMSEKEKLAFYLAFGAHTGRDQKDHAGLEYIGHPLTVFAHCDSEDTRVVALLHDVVEDTEITLEDLSLLFEPKIVEAVKLLSHEKGPYDRETYIRNIKANPIARKVKIEDLRTNMDRNRLLSLLEWHDNKVNKHYKNEFEELLKDD